MKLLVVEYFVIYQIQVLSMILGNMNNIKINS